MAQGEDPMRPFVIPKGRVEQLIIEWASEVMTHRRARGEFEGVDLQSFDIDLKFSGLESIGDITVTPKEDKG